MYMRYLLLTLTWLLVAVNVASADEWFRGNTHAHTVLCGHADSSPEVVAKWYHDHGYNFLILSEHNKFIDPKHVKLPNDKRNNFILVPGEEITGNKTIHTTAMNIKKIVPWDYDHKEHSAIIQNHVNETIKAGGLAILNHPNSHYSLTAENILPVKNLYMFELFNGHYAAHSFGDHEHQSTEEMWDQLLTEGMFIYGVSSDDSHHFQTIAHNKSNPGRGWVMVQASKLNPDEIVKAMLRGDFYASNGVFLQSYDRHSDAYVIEVDEQKTEEELSSPELRGKHIEKGTNGYKIEFIGPNGKLLKELKGPRGTYRIKKSDSYVRAKVTFTRKHPINGFEEYFAWGQPVFCDGRAYLH